MFNGQDFLKMLTGSALSISTLIHQKFGQSVKVQELKEGWAYLVFVGDMRQDELLHTVEELKHHLDECGFDYKKTPIMFSTGTADVIEL